MQVCDGYGLTQGLVPTLDNVRGREYHAGRLLQFKCGLIFLKARNVHFPAYTGI
jgi:hypothetical protein